jgi:hypothetical protein
LPDGARGTTLRNLFTGETVRAEAGPEGLSLPASALFAGFPVAVLEREG